MPARAHECVVTEGAWEGRREVLCWACGAGNCKWGAPAQRRVHDSDEALPGSGRVGRMAEVRLGDTESPRLAVGHGWRGRRVFGLVGPEPVTVPGLLLVSPRRGDS